jgi:hypothetical protein
MASVDPKGMPKDDLSAGLHGLLTVADGFEMAGMAPSLRRSANAANEPYNIPAREAKVK